MLKDLSIKNIKSFKKEANLKLAPLTLIYGLNSAGKSSLWKFLISLSRSLMRGSGKNFIYFGTPNFANPTTISFDPNEESSFGFKFDTLYYGDREKDLDLDKGLKFEFTFINTSVDPSLSNELELIKDIEKKIYEKETFLQDEKEQLLNDIYKIKKKAEQIESSKKEKKVNDDKGVFLENLNILRENKIFAKYKIIRLQYPLIKIAERARGENPLKTAQNKNQSKKRHEDEIANILESFFNGKFKRQFGYETSKENWNEQIDGPYKNQIVKYDFLGPNGPFDINVNSGDYERTNYLFLPIEISSDPFFWKEHFDFLQYLKKIILNKRSGLYWTKPEDKKISEMTIEETIDKIKTEDIKESFIPKHLEEKKIKQIYESYFEENLEYTNTYYSLRGIDANKQIPEVKQKFDTVVKAMMTDSIDEFAKIMANDFKYHIMRSSSFIPNHKLYGGFVYGEIFDSLCTKFVDSYIAMDQEDKEANEFFKNYSLFNKYSIDDQLKNLYRFEQKELRSFTENSRSSYSRDNVPSEVMTEIINSNEDNKKQIVKLLKKIGLPFEINTQEDEKGNTVMGFANKNIYGTLKNIPLTQSGNAIQSIIDIFVDLIRSENRTIIIEEPENKIHPNIQGNLIEIISDRVDFGDVNNKVIIETHSEHFILRIQKLIREGKLLPEEVAINYVYLDENGEGSKIDYMKLDNKGKFVTRWRHGFFSERLKEI